MEDEYLSDDDLLRLTSLKIIDSYRIYYTEETGEIYSITNEKLSIDCQHVEVEFETVERFLTGKDNFIFYRLEIDEEGAVKFVSKRESPVLFKSNIIEYIRVNENKDSITKYVNDIKQLYIRSIRPGINRRSPKKHWSCLLS